ncbi:MAG: RHS repeat-associated core domain-containing protein [Vicingaceae bacterium]|nr:RHS repeat-associated core domain-containing protein [Vicingaceae bacterium]
MAIKPTVNILYNYYAFGSLMPGRNASSGDYRYGFNGMEKDNEIKGAGNSYDFGSRIYDPRLGRWLAVDPQRHLYPGFAPYSSFAGNPLFFLDADGEILTDSEGNPIYVNAGIVDLKAGESYYDPKTNSYVYPVIKAQRRIYFTNEGNPIYAYDHLELGEITATKVKSNMDPRNIDVLEPEATTITYRRTGDVPNDLKYDCHGYTIIKRKSPGIKLWIGSREDNTGYDNITPVLNDDGWVNIGSDINKAKAGDLAVFRDKDGISHTAIYNVCSALFVKSCSLNTAEKKNEGS